MQTNTHEHAAAAWSMTHFITPADAAIMAAMRAALEPMKNSPMDWPERRGMFNERIEKIPAAAGVTYEDDLVGGVPGWWCRPQNAQAGAVVLYLHGGAYVVGSASSFRHFAGQVASRAGAAAFVPDYRLAPEHRFPSAVLDAQSCYRGLVDSGAKRIAIAGDSAGGGLGLVLLSLAAAEARQGGLLPIGAAVMSPWTDLALTGPSVESRADADFPLTRSRAASGACHYLGEHDSTDPLASPLYSNLTGLPPVRVHVGEDEILLDDSRRYVERAVADGVDARVDVWQGMVHVFPSSIGSLDAAKEALDAVGMFLAEKLTQPVAISLSAISHDKPLR